MALLAVVLCVNFTACSKDDERQNNGQQTGGNTTEDTSAGGNTTEGSLNLKGATWRIIESNEFGEGMILTFKKDGTITFSPYENWKITYSQTGNTLKVIFHDEGDYMKGELSSNGKTVTYVYKWYELDGTEEDSDYYYIKLQKQ